jgi:uncharacterized membrane protein
MKAVNTISGVAEIVLGIALMIRSLTSLAAWGYCTTDCRVSNSCLYVSKSKARMGLPLWALILRMPLQLLLMYWAYNILSCGN